MDTRGRIARLAVVLALTAGTTFAVAGPVAAGSPVTEDGFVLIGSDRAWATLQGTPTDTPDCTWEVQVSVVIADRLLPIGSGQPRPHGDVELWVSHCSGSVGYGTGQITGDVSMTSLQSAMLDDYLINIDGLIPVCLSLEWTATGSSRPVTGPGDQLREVSRQAPAAVSGTVTVYCGTEASLALGGISVVDAHLARSMDVHLNLP